ncbi:hypothetical protein P3S68_023635 [Capsicum galapagoense]
MRRATADILPECLQKMAASLFDSSQLEINYSFSTPYEIVDNIKERYRDGKIHKENFELSWIDDSPLVDKWLDIAIKKSYEEAAKMSILSKTWLQASLTLPNLKFTVDHSNGNMKIVAYNIMERYGKGKIPIETFELSMFEEYQLQ